VSDCRFCGRHDVNIDEDGICEACISDAMHRENDPHPPIPGIDNFDDLDDAYEQWREDDEDDWQDDDPGQDGVIYAPLVKADGTPEAAP
jgi:hypothetical protein